MKIEFGSLFTGVAGLDLGLERAGWACKYQVEIDDYCNQVLKKRYPATPRFRDVRDVGAANLPWTYAVVGGFPCTQTSTAAAVHGKREGLKGKDSGLWDQQLRIIEEVQPAIALVENVAGVLSWDAEIKRGLEGAGYHASRFTLSAWDVGAPHIRKRVFYLADRDGARLEVAWRSLTSETERLAWRTANRDAWLSSLARVHRVDDGVPGGVDRRDRIAAMGRAVPPPMAEFIGRVIARYHAETPT